MELAPVQRKIEARSSDDSFTGLVRTLYFADTFLSDSESRDPGGGVDDGLDLCSTFLGTQSTFALKPSIIYTTFTLMMVNYMCSHSCPAADLREACFFTLKQSHSTPTTN